MAQLATSNISTTLVANTLGTSTRDVGSLCTSENINKWAKYKPIDNDTVAYDTNTWLNSAYANEDGKCGLNINPVRIETGDMRWTFKTMRDQYNDPTQWQYIKASKAFRLGDFRGYQHDAVCPVRTAYRKDYTYTIPYLTDGIVFEYNIFQIAVDNHNDLPDGNLQLDDFPLSTYDGATLYFKNAKLCAMILIGTQDPLDEDVDWTESFQHGNCLFTSTNTISQDAAENGFSAVPIPVSYFVSISDYRTRTYKLVGGLLFGEGTSQFFVPLPYDDDHYPIITVNFEQRSGQGFGSELIGWAQYPTHTGWNDVKWVYTEDMVAVRPSGYSFLQFKLSTYYANDSGEVPITLDASNLSVICTNDSGWNETAQATVVTDNNTATSMTMYPNRSEPYEWNVRIDDAIPRLTLGTEFRVQIIYTYNHDQERRTIYDIEVRVTNDWQ